MSHVKSNPNSTLMKEKLTAPVDHSTGSTSAPSESSTAPTTTCTRSEPANSSSETPMVQLSLLRKTRSCINTSTKCGIRLMRETTGFVKLLKRRHALLLLVEFDDSSSESVIAETLMTQLYERLARSTPSVIPPTLPITPSVTSGMTERTEPVQ